jgi:hypothetical protein
MRGGQKLGCATCLHNSGRLTRAPDVIANVEEPKMPPKGIEGSNPSLSDFM